MIINCTGLQWPVQFLPYVGSFDDLDAFAETLIFKQSICFGFRREVLYKKSVEGFYFWKVIKIEKEIWLYTMKVVSKGYY